MNYFEQNYFERLARRARLQVKQGKQPKFIDPFENEAAWPLETPTPSVTIRPEVSTARVQPAPVVVPAANLAVPSASALKTDASPPPAAVSTLPVSVMPTPPAKSLPLPELAPVLPSAVSAAMAATFATPQASAGLEQADVFMRGLGVSLPALEEAAPRIKAAAPAALVDISPPAVAVRSKTPLVPRLTPPAPHMPLATPPAARQPAPQRTNRTAPANAPNLNAVTHKVPVAPKAVTPTVVVVGERANGVSASVGLGHSSIGLGQL